MASHEDDDQEGSSDDDNQTKGTQIMLSYQWDNQKLVEEIYKFLTKAQTMPVWMDTHGGMQDNVFLSMSQGVQGCAVLVCFLTPAYQKSVNCKKELTYALDTHTPIIPCIIGSKEEGIKWKATDWLGMSIANLLYLDFSQVNSTNFQSKCLELLKRIQAVTNA